ncbi:GNAT family N-acetyltransferase [Ewingella americana]|uniref:GNAT family N-acetyltransferase n=1 Tax=Ewingella americana TaxID=41202 RepID=UPI001639A55E|nr:GNAT family N-acetyltransferase [Ewingella americana]QMV54005.1 GNAT family N-acetyltransferase [Ewingella americana]
MSITYRQCIPGDEAALALLGGATFLETYALSANGADILSYVAQEHTPEAYRAMLVDPEIKIWAAETDEGKSLIGFVVLATAEPDDPSSGEIKRLYVLHRFHGEGLGSRLLKQAVQAAQSDGCRKLSLIVQDLNASAENFYRRFGFEIVHVEPCRVGSTDYVVSVMQLSL